MEWETQAQIQKDRQMQRETQRQGERDRQTQAQIYKEIEKQKLGTYIERERQRSKKEWDLNRFNVVKNGLQREKPG